MVSSVVGKIGILSLTPEPRFLKRNELFCQVRAVYKPEAHNTNIQPPPMQATSTPDQNKTLSKCDPRSKRYQHIRANFMYLLDECDHIFDPNIKGCKGAEGQFETTVNMGPAEPPQQEGRLPSMAATNYWNSNRSLTSSKHWASLNAPKTSTS